eukprot:1477355-Alexandrium_andersonii.AAC.1
MINAVRRYERKNGSGKCTPQSAWHVATRAPLLQEFGRPQLGVSQAGVAAAAPTLPDEVFDYKPSESAFVDSEWKSLSADKP